MDPQVTSGPNSPQEMALTAPFDPADLFRSTDFEEHAVSSLEGDRYNYVWNRGGYSRPAYARGLSLLHRFIGQTDRPYTVAEHCLWVCSWLSRVALNQGADPTLANNLALAGLVHDAPEALTGDMPSPLKRLPALERYRWVEGGIEEGVLRSLGLVHLCPGRSSRGAVLSRADWDLVHVADRLAYLVECRDLRGGRNDPRMPQDRIVPVGDAAVIAQTWLDELNRRHPL